MTLLHSMAEDTLSRQTLASDLETTTSSAVSQSEWVDDLRKLMIASEEAELKLSYLSPCGTENGRKLSGSYYTPADVATFFWREFFRFHGLDDLSASKDYIRQTRFLEPAAGAGALIFALLHRLALTGLRPQEVAEIELCVVDINKRALAFIQEQLIALGSRWHVTFGKVSFTCGDFRSVEVARSSKPLTVFGNPPFVSNPAGSSPWKNLFADFVEIALRHADQRGALHFILPISVAFSRDFQELRKMLVASGQELVLSHFDNIPDTLFKSGKPGHTNTNKANSQRCSILTLRPSATHRVLSTELHRWSKYDRASFLEAVPTYHDVTNYQFDGQFPRPANRAVLGYLTENRTYTRLGDLLHPRGSSELYVAAVARNFIGIRDTPGGGAHCLRFAEQDDLHRVLLLLASDLFFAYWRTVGDGFHVTKANVLDFPVTPRLMDATSAQLRSAKRLWAKRSEFIKSKLNAGQPTHSYDFSKAAPRLLELI